MRDSGGRKPFRKSPTDSFRKKKTDGFAGKSSSDKKKSFGSKSSDDSRPAKRGEGRGTGERKFGEKSFGSSDRPYKKRDDGDFKPFKKRDDGHGTGERKFGDKSFEKRDGGRGTSERKFGDKSDYAKKASSDRPDYAKKASSDRPFAKKSFGSSDRGEKSFEKRDGGRGTGERKFGEKSFGSSDRPYKKRDEGDFKPFKKRDEGHGTGERKFGEKPFSKKPFGSSDRGERKFGNSEGSERRFDDKPFGKKSYGNKKSSSARPFKKREEGSSFSPNARPEKSFGKRSASDKPINRSYKGQGNANKSKPFDSDKADASEWQVFSNADEAKDFIKSSRSDKKTSSKSVEEKPVEYKNENRPLKAKSFSGDDSGMRLNRFIANTGICSRREADDLIAAGVVKINGKIVTELGTKISPSDTIHYGDQLLRREKMSYVLLNKPKDYITTTEDPQERKTVMHLIESAGKERIYPVGRLDRNTTGLLLFTNDGDLAERLTHPKYGIRKIYHASLDKNLRKEDFDKILAGVTMEDGFMQADELSYVGDGTDKKEVGIVIHSGRNRIVRRLFEELGYDVVRLDRVVYAGLTKKNLPRSSFRHLTAEEVGMLRMQIGGEKKVSNKQFGKSQSKGKGKREKK